MELYTWGLIGVCLFYIHVVNMWNNRKTSSNVLPCTLLHLPPLPMELFTWGLMGLCLFYIHIVQYEGQQKDFEQCFVVHTVLWCTLLHLPCQLSSIYTWGVDGRMPLFFSFSSLRSPSPEPIYNHEGKRLNTREYRMRKKLEEDRHKMIQDAITMNPEYKPPADYK